MRKPGIPPQEAERLAALRSLNLLDTAPSESFDRITRLAAQLLDVPVALVTLVDETRQWFKSKLGFDIAESSRDVSFCAHAVCERQILIVPDATQDERFAGNPMVTDTPHITAYLGVPLYSREGHAIGTLCAIDMRPRDFDVHDVKVLSDLAKILEESVQSQELAASTKTILHFSAERERLFRDAFEHAVVGIVHTNLTGQLLRANQRTCEMLGYAQHELHELSVVDITHPDDIVRSTVLFQAMMAGNCDSFELETRLLRKDGSHLWAHLSVALKRSASGQSDYVITAMEDIEARKRAQAALLDAKGTLQAEVARQTAELHQNNLEFRTQIKKLMDAERTVRQFKHRMHALANSLAAMIAYWNRDLHCEFANKAHRESFALEPEQIMGMTMPDLLGQAWFKAIEPHVRLALAGHPQRFERSHQKADGTQIFVEIRYVPDLNETMNVRGFFVLVTDVTQSRLTRMALEAANAKLTNDSVTDTLTGLSNRRVFSERVEEASRRFKKAGEVYAVILVDLDNFKQINDVHGHDAGDEVLRSVGKLLKGQLRSHRDVAARLGGEEFALLCFGDLDPELLHLIAERLRSQINEQLIQSDQGDLRFTGSVGYAISHSGDNGWKQVYSRADSALNEAKASGKNRVTYGRTHTPVATPRLVESPTRR
jgi:diguanylate cyclase